MGLQQPSAILNHLDKIAIASSRRKQSLVDLLGSLEIALYIDMICVEQDVNNPKPAPDMVNKILHHLAVDAADTLVVGDTTFNIEMGKMLDARRAV